MRLINSKTLKMEEFVSSPGKTPDYAILSHTWGDNEASFAQWTRSLTRLRKTRQPGFAKILSACKQARQDSLSYVWADTVCIDKSSSAELSEAINSMFAWYQRAMVCYVYLSDVPTCPPDQIDFLDLLRKSRWFTRGWTLQELIAPDQLVFYSNSWEPLGTKKALASLISNVTGIDQACLCQEKRLKHYSIAQRMAWAADRSTTRDEDMAYCLLGIFDINMALLYGEGKKSFIRLQEEIIKVSDDQSILAFDTMHSKNSLFADHPVLFRSMSRVQASFASRLTSPYSLTNAGLSIRTPLIRTLSPYWVFAVLNCVEVDARNNFQRSPIYLSLFGKDGKYMRDRASISLMVQKTLTDTTNLGRTMQIEDLATPVETAYLICSFTRIYPAFGNELDSTLNGFDTKTMETSGFMLTFPRGMHNYHVHSAYPRQALQEETSFFNPTCVTSYQYFPHGLVVFQDDTVEPPARIGVYLAHNLDESGAGEWMCVLNRAPDARLYDLCNETWQFEADPKDWCHYDHVGNFIVAARVKFVYNFPPRHVIMVEVVFDAHTLLREKGLERSGSTGAISLH